MAVGTEIIRSLARSRKVSRSFSMDACPPVSKYRTVALTAEPVAFRKVDQISVIEPQPISIFRIMAIETPSHRLRMV